MVDVYIDIDRDHFGNLQLAIGTDSMGHRLAGPEYVGKSKRLLRHILTDRDLEAIEQLLVLKRASHRDANLPAWAKAKLQATKTAGLEQPLASRFDLVYATQPGAS